MFAEFGPIFVESGSKFVDSGPSLTEFGPWLVDPGANIGRDWTSSNNIWSKPGQIWSNSDLRCPFRANSGRFKEMWAELGRWSSGKICSLPGDRGGEAAVGREAEPQPPPGHWSTTRHQPRRPPQQQAGRQLGPPTRSHNNNRQQGRPSARRARPTALLPHQRRSSAHWADRHEGRRGTPTVVAAAARRLFLRSPTA